jgi:hypothetical protein
MNKGDIFLHDEFSVFKIIFRSRKHYDMYSEVLILQKEGISSLKSTFS